MICKCGSTEFGYFNDLGQEYNYCLKCNRAYDLEGNEIMEGGDIDDEGELSA
jgi:hypothetical protein